VRRALEYYHAHRDELLDEDTARDTSSNR